MSRKIVSISAILILTSIIVIVFLYLRNQQRFEDNNPLKCIPQDAGLIIQLNQAEEFSDLILRKGDFISDLSLFDSWQQLQAIAEFVDSSAVLTYPPFSNFKTDIYTVSFHPDTSKSIAWLLNIPLRNNSEIKQLKDLVFQRFNQKLNDSGKIFTFEKNINFPITLFGVFKKGVLSLSSSLALVERVYDSIDSDNVMKDPSFVRIQQTSLNKNLASIYFNFQRLIGITSHLTNNVDYSAWASWVELDLDLRKDAVFLNGFSCAETDSLITYLYRGIEPARSEITEVLPSSSKLIVNYTFSSNSRFKENLNRYIQNVRSSSGYDDKLLGFEKRHNGEFSDLFFSIVEKEAALVYTSSGSTPFEYHKLLVFNTYGQSRSLEEMQKWMRDNKRSPEPTYWVDLDQETRFPVYEMPEATVMRNYFGFIFPEVPSVYFAFYENYLVFADTRDAMREFLYANLLKKNMASHPYFGAFSENFSYQGNFFFFVEIQHIFPLLNKNFNKKFFHPTVEQNKALSNFYGLGIQLSSASDLMYTNVYANHAPHRDKEPRTIWQSRLDSTVVGKPTLVDNHNTGDKEVMVQDAKNNLYLINSVGRILWKRPLDGPIMSEISQVDYYRNNKFQFLFNTADRIYLLDRNGNYVDKYPITLPEKATNGLAVFDYENNKDYRLFLALADKKIYLYDKNGNRNVGWSFPKTEGFVKQPLQHFVTQGRDYLVFADNYRCYVVDRRGETRVTPNQQFSSNPNSLFYLENQQAENPALLTTTVQGELVRLALPSGQTTITKQVDVSGPHSFVYLTMPNGQNRFVYITEKSVVIFNDKGKQLAKKEFENTIYPSVDVYQFSSNDIKLGILEQKGGRIHLLNLDGSEYSGFPLKGVSRFSIGFLKSSYLFNLITGGEQYYLYNYRVE
ncbi:MAG TPA: hypothetical protein VJ855_02720 [Marinilabiliaceae bacterium]|nr:hypothetical protein [Marinilabiliaceae bacterium]